MFHGLPPHFRSFPTQSRSVILVARCQVVLLRRRFGYMELVDEEYEAGAVYACCGVGWAAVPASAIVRCSFLRTWGFATHLGNCLCVSLVLVDGPVVIVLETLTEEEITEDLSEVGVVGLIVEKEGPRVVEVDGELVGKSAEENLRRGGHPSSP